jgi:hypothetical protein
MVKVTLTMDTERDTVTVNAKMCMDGVLYIPEIIAFIQRLENENKYGRK